MNKENIIKSRKAERHLHGGLGCSIEAFRKICGVKVKQAPLKIINLKEMNNYIKINIIEHFYKPHIFENVIETALIEAANDGVTIIEMSIDYNAANFYSDKEKGLASFLSNLINKYAYVIDFRPELGVAREADIKETYEKAIKCLNTGVFKSIDLYGIEDAQKVTKFQILFKEAKNFGLKLKAHAGEFGNEFSVMETVEVLNLDEVQHGISAVKSKDVLKYLKEKNVRLNICPTSNVRLGIIPNIKNHPIKKIFNEGVRISINTDDIMIFGQTLSDEYYNLYKAGLFSENEIKLLMESSLID